MKNKCIKNENMFSNTWFMFTRTLKCHILRHFPRNPGMIPKSFDVGSSQFNVGNDRQPLIQKEFGLKVLSSFFTNHIFVGKSRVFGSFTHYFLRRCRCSVYILSDLYNGTFESHPAKACTVFTCISHCMRT